MNKKLIIFLVLSLLIISSCSKSDKPIIKEEKKCSDGTKVASCSVEKPKYCFNNGELLNKCDLCGCSSELQCSSDGSCKEPIVEKDNLQDVPDQLDAIDNL